MIGLDIGSKFIKICQVEKKGDKHHILLAMMATNPLATRGEKQDADVVNRIRSALKGIELPSRAAATSVGGAQISARNFSFPLLTADELKGAVKLEAEQSIFSDLNMMYTDYQVLTPGDKEKLDVLYVAVPREMVERHMQIIESSGLDMMVMDIDNLALSNCYLAFDPNPGKESVVLLNIGHAQTNISVIDGGELRFVRNVSFGGKDISAEIANSFGVTPEAAEEIKKQPALWGELGLNIKNILRKSMPDLLEAIYRSIEYCMSRKKLINVDKILLTGGTSCLQGIDGFIAEVIGITTEKWNPIAGIEIKGRSKKEMGRFLSVALGLAIRGEKNV
ncbi:MAG: type IV pilus assembly protein PilM [Endomicrobiales bacterium]